ncbi:Mu-like prophage protein gp16 [Leminorella richardii]|uniref:Mu-like prophage protein gp16 n=1 Tax=Leminorella richardii TaxID=158841 RepID=A0A2X4XEB4_9GAMM|nr:regulatory protein GemA [Leminorella richardii]SQI34974.1 Mu-like prophage protein gp16 [Leminorella richardii]
MNKPQLIRLIHVAKTQLGMDDETYRAKLDALTGKTSCSQMSLDQLNAVYQSFKDAGFKRQFKKKGGARVTPNAKGQSKAPEIPKIRAIWCVMAEQGFVKSASETSLNGFVKRMTASLNNGAGVAEVGWLNSRLACQVLETLKGWHLREMKKALKARRIHLPRDRSGRTLESYDPVSSLYVRIIQHDNYLARHHASGSHMLDTYCPFCGYRSEVPAPTDCSEKWDSLAMCPACAKQVFRVITSNRIFYGKGGVRL